MRCLWEPCSLSSSALKVRACTSAAFTRPTGMEPDRKAKAQLLHPLQLTLHHLQSHTSSKPTDLGSSRSLRPKLTQPCPNIRSRRDPTPAYQERTPHLPMTTPSKINRFITTQLFNLSKTSCPYGKNPTCTVASATIPRSTEGLRVCHCFPESLSASQPFNATLPTSTTCSAFPALASAVQPSVVKEEKKPKNAVAWHGSFQRAMGFTASHRQARLAAMLMRRRTAARSNGHCSTKLTVHLLLAADAGESGL